MFSRPAGASARNLRAGRPLRQVRQPAHGADRTFSDISDILAKPDGPSPKPEGNPSPDDRWRAHSGLGIRHSFELLAFVIRTVHLPYGSALRVLVHGRAQQNRNSSKTPEIRGKKIC